MDANPSMMWGFTQTWDTAGVGEPEVPTTRELSGEKRIACSVRLSVSYVGHKKRPRHGVDASNVFRLVSFYST